MHPLAEVVGRPRTVTAFGVGARDKRTPRLGAAVLHTEIAASAAARVATVAARPEVAVSRTTAPGVPGRHRRQKEAVLSPGPSAQEVLHVGARVDVPAPRRLRQLCHTKMSEAAGVRVAAAPPVPQRGEALPARPVAQATGLMVLIAPKTVGCGSLRHVMLMSSIAKPLRDS